MEEGVSRSVDWDNMVQVELVPSLTSCVETEAKREYRETLGKLLGFAEQPPEMEERLELLRMFLETTDFRKLRSDSERHLVVGKRVKFTLYWEDGKPGYRMMVE